MTVRPTTKATKTLPPFPDDALSGMPTHMLDRAQLVKEFDALFTWLKAADEAPGDYHIRDEIFRDKVGERVDNLRRWVFA